MTRPLYREDPYLTECGATIVAADQRGYVLDASVFYPQGGGQPGDAGTLVSEDGAETSVISAAYGEDRTQIVHIPADGAAVLAPGSRVIARLDWRLRHLRMRIHTALHLLSVVLPFPVTGGAIGDGEGRLDFDIQDSGLDKVELTEKLNALVARDASVLERWITDDELDSNPALVKTMSVQPPRGSGRIRLIEIDGIDLQPCGGTHVRSTGEIGRVAITDIQKKGRQNRRVRIALVD
ncbi:MAG: alanyl-tRNA editing protein [Salinarimonadaceae bacterium]|nr:MAG: alanyl-tRNA editing protein [Salinarimonadaceae bacterium]